MSQTADLLAVAAEMIRAADVEALAVTVDTFGGININLAGGGEATGKLLGLIESRHTTYYPDADGRHMRVRTEGAYCGRRVVVIFDRPAPAIAMVPLYPWGPAALPGGAFA